MLTLAFEPTKLGKRAGASCREDIQDLAKTWLQSTNKKTQKSVTILTCERGILFMWGLRYRDFNCWQAAWQNKNSLVEQKHSAECLMTERRVSGVCFLVAPFWLHVKRSFLFQPKMPLLSVLRYGVVYYVKPDMTY